MTINYQFGDVDAHLGDLADLCGAMDSKFVRTATVNHQCMLQSQGRQGLRNDIEEFRFTDTQYLIGQWCRVHQGTDEIEDCRVLPWVISRISVGPWTANSSVPLP